MLDVFVESDRISFGDQIEVMLQRTVRVPNDDQAYDLPAGLGSFPLLRVEEYAERVPPTWKERGGVFIPMYQHEALWIAFIGVPWRPCAIKVGLGPVNALSGAEWSETLQSDPQDYVVYPEQPWVDGVKVSEGLVRQFVAVPLGSGATVEGQLTGEERVGGLRIMVFAPKPGRVPEQPAPGYDEGLESAIDPGAPARDSMGLAVGGLIQQKIYPDPYGVDTWDPANRGEVFIHILNSQVYREVTGREPPPTPISLDTYEQAGIPWFKLADEALADIPVVERLALLTPTPEPASVEGAGAEEAEQPRESAPRQGC
jgi:hypothetical protein